MELLLINILSHLWLELIKHEQKLIANGIDPRTIRIKVPRYTLQK